MKDFINPNPYTVHLLDQDGKIVKIKGGKTVSLPDYFNRYVPRGFIRLASAVQKVATEESLIQKPQTIQGRIQLNQNRNKRNIQLQNRTQQKKPIIQSRIIQRPIKANALSKTSTTVSQKIEKRIVGRAINKNATELLYNNLHKNSYPISNNIGIGILSYNRPHSLQRLIASILTHTNLQRTTIFISDDGSDNPQLIDYLNELSKNNNFIVLKNTARIGIAGNSNRLLRCLKRFKYGLLLNDDVEILEPNWDQFYFNAMEKTGFHHFIFRQPGIYGAVAGDTVVRSDQELEVVNDKPHGAILAFDYVMLKIVGYFNESYGLYGMEHVDWSRKAFDFELQEDGFFDVKGSDKYFQLHSDPSAVQDRSNLLNNAKKLYNNRVIERLELSDISKVPEISYIIPFRNFHRANSIRTVINNIRAQRFPSIDIIIVEQDNVSTINLDDFIPINYHKTLLSNIEPFNKSMAFNYGVKHAKTPFIVLHDADIMAQGHYTQTVYDNLINYDACHLGKAVVYADTESTKLINATGIVDNNVICDRIVGYFEGGSLACKRDTYWKVGAFNEDFWGYGCFEGQTPILMSDGTLQRIDSLKEGDLVVTHTGAIKPIVNIFKRAYRGNAYKLHITSIGHRLITTEEHPFQIDNGDTIEWVEASELQVNDRVILSMAHNKINDIQLFNVLEELHNIGDFIIKDNLVYSTRCNQTSKKMFIDGSAIGFKSILDLDNDLLDLIGYYAAEGCASPKNGLRFSVHETEFKINDIGFEICRIIKNFNLNYKINRRGTSRGRDIQTFCLPLVKLFKKWFPEIKNDKKFPSWIMQLPNNKQVRILAALIKGDGYISDRYIKLRMGNQNLVSQAIMLATKCGCHPKYHKRPSVYDAYEMSILRNSIPIELCELLNIEPQTNKRITDQVQNIRTIRSIDKFKYNDYVYNIEVADDHSYSAGYVSVKNCEDCNFYARLSGLSNWREHRTFDFLHLWHTRVPEWNKHHNHNKELEAKLKAQPLKEQLRLQQKQLTKLGYTQFLDIE